MSFSAEIATVLGHCNLRSLVRSMEQPCAPIGKGLPEREVGGKSEFQHICDITGVIVSKTDQI